MRLLATTSCFSVCWLLLAMCQLVISNKPNIVMLMVDDMGWNDIGRHGSEIQTPNIDGLMGEGLELQSYYAAPNCGPSRVQFLSGKYRTTLGLQHKNLIACRPMALPADEKTIAEHLKGYGYRSHIAGKWHAGYYSEEHIPTRRGFDTFKGMLLGMGDHYKHTRSYSRTPYLDWHNGAEPYRLDEGVYSTTAIENHSMDVIDSHSDAGDPMFLWVSYTAPHTPLQAPQEYLDMYSQIIDSKRQKFAAMVTAMDDSIGRIIRKLKDNGMYNNTLIVFSSDNGGQAFSGASNFPFRGNKATYYEGGVRVLGAVSGGLVPRTGVSSALFHITDWLPTFVHLASGKPWEDLPGPLIDGIDQWSMIEGGSGTREVILHNIDPLSKNGKKIWKYRKVFDTSILAAIQWRNWKLITGKHGITGIVPNPVNSTVEFDKQEFKNSQTIQADIQLYNLQTDPTESLNMATQEPATTERMLAMLADYADKAAPVIYPDVSSLCDPGLRGGVWSPYLDSPLDIEAN